MPVFKKSPGYTLQAAAIATSPADSTTAFLGCPAGGTLGSVNNQRIYVPKSGIIRAVQLFYANTGVLGSSESATVSLRLNNATDVLISNAVTNDAAQTAFSNMALNVRVAAGDFFEIKHVWPAWVTNPTAIRASASIYID